MPRIRVVDYGVGKFFARLLDGKGASLHFVDMGLGPLLTPRRDDAAIICSDHPGLKRRLNRLHLGSQELPARVL